MSTFFVDVLQQYGYPALWLIVFVAAAGAPVSGSLLLFASGAFAALGDFNIFILFPLALSAAVMGDNLGYFIGRRVGTALIGWLERQKRFRFITPEALERGRAYFRRRTGWTIFITGLEQYPYTHFLFWDVSGQILGAVIPLGLGYIFARSWEEVASIFGALSSLVLALIVVMIFFTLFVRKLRQNRRARVARVASMAGAEENATPQVLVEMVGTLQPLDANAGHDSGSLLMPD